MQLFVSFCQQMLEAEKEKMRSELEHHRKSQAYQELEYKVHRLEKANRRSISTARPYYELKSNLELQLQVRGARVVQRIMCVYANTISKH